MTNELFIATATILGKLSTVLLLAIGIIQILHRTEPRWRVIIARAVLVGLPLVLLAGALQPQFSLAVLPPTPAAEIPIDTSNATPVAINSPSPPPTTTPSSAPFRIPFVYWLLAPWGLVSLALIAREWFRFSRFSSLDQLEGTTPPDTTLTHDWIKVCTEFGVDAPRLQIVSENTSPYLVSGHFKALVIPDSLASPENRDLLRHVFRHEAAHLAQHDPIWIPLARFATCFLWFHPLAWWLESLHLRACEEACDAEAARRGGSDEYSGALAKLALEFVPQQHPATAFLRVPSVQNRIRCIEHHAHLHPPAPWKTLPLVGAFTVIALAAGNLGIAQQPGEAGPLDDAHNLVILQDKLKTIIIPDISFDDTPLEEALAFLQKQSSELDPLGSGIQALVAKDASDQSKTPVTVQLTNIPLIEALRYTASLVDLGLTYGPDNKVLFAPIEDVAAQEKELALAAHPAVQATEAKLKKIVIPSIEFVNVSLPEAVETLRDFSIELDQDTIDPARRGINVIIEGGPHDDKRVTLKLSNVPLAEALRYVAELSGATYRVEPFAVIISDKLVPAPKPAAKDKSSAANAARDTSLYTRTYELPPSLFDLDRDARETLEEAGIAFPPGTAAVFNPSKHQLIIRNTLDQVEYIEAWLETASGTSPGPVEVEPKERDNSVALLTKAYPLPEAAFRRAQNRFGKSNIQEIFDQLGVGFPPGTAATYNPAQEQIIIRNTAMQLKSVESWIETLRDLD